jgi:hypothetical protein
MKRGHKIDSAVRITTPQILFGSALAFLLPLPIFAAALWSWKSTLLLIPASLGWLVAPLFLYFGIRRMIETGWSLVLLTASLLSAFGLALWIYAIYVSLHRLEHGIAA